MYLGLDIGTSSVKAVLVDGDDRLVDQDSAALTVSRTAASPAVAMARRRAGEWRGRAQRR